MPAATWHHSMLAYPPMAPVDPADCSIADASRRQGVWPCIPAQVACIYMSPTMQTARRSVGGGFLRSPVPATRYSINAGSGLWSSKGRRLMVCQSITPTTLVGSFRSTNILSSWRSWSDTMCYALALGRNNGVELLEIPFNCRWLPATFRLIETWPAHHHCPFWQW